MKTIPRSAAKVLSALLIGGTFTLSLTAQAAPIAVTVDNFVRAESDWYFGTTVKRGGFGRFYHFRELAPLGNQTVVRVNRDTLYSTSVFDLDAGPVTITLPDPGKRFVSMQATNQDHYVPTVVYGGGTHTFTKEAIGTRYVLLAVRMLVDPKNPQDMQQAHGLQDAIRVTQSGTGRFEVPEWDLASQKKVRLALRALGDAVPNLNSTFGTREQVTPVHHLIGTATAWGGNPSKDATYPWFTPSHNDGSTIHRLRVGKVPVDAFWSVSVYNAEGFFEKNPQDAYVVNNITGVKGEDGSVTIQFGGCNATVPNCLPITPGWNYLVRLYRPRAEILSGQWTLPEAQPVR